MDSCMPKHDPQAFEGFYRANLDRIYRYVYFRVLDRDVAEDLVADVFLLAYAHFASYDPSVSVSAWIYRIAKNRLADHFRDRKMTVQLEEIEAFLPD